MHRITAALLAALPALALAADPAPDATPVELVVGEQVNVCRAGWAICPATVMCDAPGVAVGVATADGQAIRGVAPGTTLCAVASSSGAGARRVVRVTVKAR